MTDFKAVDEETEILAKRKPHLPNSADATLEDDRGRSDSSKKQKIEVPAEKNGSASLKVLGTVAESDEEDNEDEEEYNAEEEQYGYGDPTEDAENFDTKGKGIIRDDKGKGKVIEDSEDDDIDDQDGGDDDSSDDSGSDLSFGLDESDMEDDPLAEVDLSNILPARTRQRQMQPGVRIVNDSDKGNDA